MRYILLLMLTSLVMRSGCSGVTEDIPGDTHIPQTDTMQVVCGDNGIQGSDEVLPPATKNLTNYEIARLSIGIPGKDSIDHWLDFVGLPPGNPFCSAANCAWNEYARLWHPKSGLARHWKTMQPGGMWIDAERVLAQQVVIPAGSIALYARIGTIFGHVGIVTQEFTGVGSLYISANTSPPGSGGSEFSGGGVYEKQFSIVPGSTFRIIGFIVFV
jgi:hypothetical protein